MRTENEMLDLILDYAKSDERVRAVTMEGSRTNPNAPRDLFQDYDISYHVTEMESYLRNPSWIDVFGERIILQMPEDMSMFPPELGARFSYLMLFADGNRIDLTLIPVEEVEAYCKEDKLMKVLLDKDGRFPELPASTDEDYWVKRPTAEWFADCCNEFWWVSTYVAKGLWRKEMLYAQEHLNRYVRPMLIKMLEWQAGIGTGFAVSAGKNGKYLENYLPEPSWRTLMATYADGSYESVWNALFAAGELFRRTAVHVAGDLGFEYPEEDDRRVTAYLKRVRQLPPNARDFDVPG